MSDEQVWERFHALWGQAQESPEYVKRAWGEFQLLLEDILRCSAEARAEIERLRKIIRDNFQEAK